MEQSAAELAGKQFLATRLNIGYLHSHRGFASFVVQVNRNIPDLRTSKGAKHAVYRLGNERCSFGHLSWPFKHS
jgi:hypothetical protein